MERTRAASLADVLAAQRMVVHLGGKTICLLASEGEVYAVDNRCPHMGFPLHRGSVARRDPHLPLAPRPLRPLHRRDVRPVGRRPAPLSGGGRGRRRLRRPDAAGRPARPPAAAALRRAAARTSRSSSPSRRSRWPTRTPTGADAFRAGLEFGALRRGGGWFRGLTMLTCLMNLVPRLAWEERSAALYHGLADVASDSAMEAPRFPLDPLPGTDVEPVRLGRWFRRLHRSARRRRRRAGARLGDRARARRRSSSRTCCSRPRPTTATSTAATRSTSSTRRSRRSTSPAGSTPRRCCASLCPQLAFAERMEESNAWRNPVDLVALLEEAFEQLPGRAARRRRLGRPRTSSSEVVLDGEAAEILDALLAALREGARRGRARLGGRLRRGDADRALPDQQRVRRLGHRAAHVHVRQRGRAGPAALALAGAAARRARRGDERLPRPLPERAGGAPAAAGAGRRPGGAARRAAGPARRPAAGRRGRAARGVVPRRERRPASR